MRKLSKLLAVMLALVMAVGMTATAIAAEPEEPTAPAPAEGAITVLYTNDAHTYIDKSVPYSLVAGYRATLENALLVDAGDHIQGTAYGSMDKGKTIIDIMNATGYDAATLGNHEFDYGMEGTMNVIDWAEYPYLSCNFYHEANGVKGENVLDAYKVFEVNGKKIAFIGITTPESFTKSTPAYFQDGNGNYIYGIAGGLDGSGLYAAVQAAIDDASKEADIVIGLGHLGIDESSKPWTSKELIANTTGLDAFIDGHSHSTVPMEKVTDKGGNTVILTQTGSYLGALGQMTIGADGTITTELLTAEDLAGVTPDAEVKAIEDAWMDKIQEELGQIIGTTAVTLDCYDTNGKRLVRSLETNTGDFAADALYYLFDDMGLDVDCAIMNGGGIRNTAITGDISYLSCKSIHTFGNVACLITVTGQQLIDALEFGARGVGTGEEIGGFLLPSHLKYTIDTSVKSTATMDDKGVFTGVTGEYRVKDVQIYDKDTDSYVPVDPAGKYNLAGYNYTLRDCGDGFSMFEGSVNVLDYVMEDYMVLANYVGSFEKNDAGLPVVTGYDDLLGAGRISVKMYDDVDVTETYAPDVAYLAYAGIMNGKDGGKFDAAGTTSGAEFATVLARMAGDDTTTGATWYEVGMTYATEKGVTVTAEGAVSQSDAVAAVAKIYTSVTADELTALMDEDATLTRAELALLAAAVLA